MRNLKELFFLLNISKRLIYGLIFVMKSMVKFSIKIREKNDENSNSNWVGNFDNK